MHSLTTRRAARIAILTSAGGLALWTVALAGTVSQPEKTPPPPPAAPAAKPDQPAKEAGKQPEKPSPATDPNLTDPTVEQIIKDLERPGAARRVVRPGDEPAAEPVRPGIPGLDVGAGAEPSRLLRQGTFLTSRRGRVARSAAGEWMLVFDSDADADASTPADRPMVLQPCLNLMAMEKVAERHGEAAAFEVTGEVFVYHSRNYLLVRHYQIVRTGGEIRTAQ